MSNYKLDAELLLCNNQQVCRIYSTIEEMLGTSDMFISGNKVSFVYNNVRFNIEDTGHGVFALRHGRELVYAMDNLYGLLLAEICNNYTNTHRLHDKLYVVIEHTLFGDKVHATTTKTGFNRVLSNCISYDSNTYYISRASDRSITFWEESLSKFVDEYRRLPNSSKELEVFLCYNIYKKDKVIGNWMI